MPESTERAFLIGPFGATDRSMSKRTMGWVNDHDLAAGRGSKSRIHIPLAAGNATGLRAKDDGGAGRPSPPTLAFGPAQIRL
jgi:hypothetical protein